MVREAVDHRGGAGAAEDLVPAAERAVAGHDQRGPLVAVGDELEEEVGGVRVERGVADLVHDQQRVGVQRGQFLGEPPGRPRPSVSLAAHCAAVANSTW